MATTTITTTSTTTTAAAAAAAASRESSSIARIASRPSNVPSLPTYRAATSIQNFSQDIERQANYGTFRPKPVIVSEYQNLPSSLVFIPPYISPLVFENSASDARDHCANERNFLSYLRLSMYLTIISIAVTLSFHFKNDSSSIETRMALPLGLIFWVLSFATLVTGICNYFGTVEKYRRQRPVVENGLATNIVFGVVGTTILATCIILLEAGATERS